jgi:hypothetical protein
MHSCEDYTAPFVLKCAFDPQTTKYVIARLKEGRSKNVVPISANQGHHELLKKVCPTGVFIQSKDASILNSNNNKRKRKEKDEDEDEDEDENEDEDLVVTSISQLTKKESNLKNRTDIRDVAAEQIHKHLAYDKQMAALCLGVGQGAWESSPGFFEGTTFTFIKNLKSFTAQIPSCFATFLTGSKQLPDGIEPLFRLDDADVVRFATSPPVLPTLKQLFKLHHLKEAPFSHFLSTKPKVAAGAGVGAGVGAGFQAYAQAQAPAVKHCSVCTKSNAVDRTVCWECKTDF